MNIFLGDVSISQIEARTGIKLSEADKEYMVANYQAKVKDTKLETGKWHCFDIPFMLMTRNKQTAIIYRDMLLQYDWSNCRELLQIGWEEGEAECG